jgi:hypothetical protein
MSPENQRPSRHQQTIDELVEYVKSGKIIKEAFLYFAKHNPERIIIEISSKQLLNFNKKDDDEEITRWQNLCIFANWCAGRADEDDLDLNILMRALDPSMTSKKFYQAE